MNAEPIVELRSVAKTYDGKVNVIENLDLAIYDGEFLTLLGPSGSGKTTILMMLAGFESPTAGDVLLRGRSLENVPPYKRNMGVVFQNYALFPHLSVARNVAYPLQRRGMNRTGVRERVAQALDMVELGDLGGRRPSQLSGGQQQRVALARALVFEPEVVLMDEPLGALDKKLREQMQIELKRLHQALNMTFIYVTHDQGEAVTMSDRIAVFDEGRIQQLGTPRSIYETPVNGFVANFIGENNNLPAVVETWREGSCHLLLENGHRVEAVPAGKSQAGKAVVLSIRPERVSVGREAKRRTNRTEAEILEITYFGDHVRVRLSVAGNDEFLAKIPAGDDVEKLVIGEKTDIGWDADKCRALFSQ